MSSYSYVNIYGETFFLYKQKLQKDAHEAECKNEAIVSTGFSVLSTSTTKEGLFGCILLQIQLLDLFQF